jgi:hypothetical protein
MIASPSTCRGFAALVLVVAAATGSTAAHAQPPAAAPAAPKAATPAATAPALAAEWAPLAFLVGRWEADGGGAPGASTGTFSFEAVADGHALLRRNESISPSGRHTDVMLIHSDGAGGFGATYADNEGHVIRYAVTATAEPKGVVFLSDAGSGGPRFRLTYRHNPDGTVAIAFDIAPPGGTEFKNYVQGVGHRK